MSEPTYKELQAQAAALGLKSVGVSAVDLKASIDAKTTVVGDGSGEPLPPTAVAIPASSSTGTEVTGTVVITAAPGAIPPASAPPGVVYTTSSDQRALIVRTNGQKDWWCPFCDHSMNSKLPSCRECGAVRDGDEAVKA